MSIDIIQFFVVLLVESSQFSQFRFDGGPFELAYLFVLFMLFLWLFFSRVVLVVYFSDCLLQLYEVSVLSFLDLGAFDRVLLEGFYFLFERCDLFFECDFVLFGVLVFVDF